MLSRGEEAKVDSQVRSELLEAGLGQCGADGLKRLINYIDRGGRLLMNGDIYCPDEGCG